MNDPSTPTPPKSTAAPHFSRRAALEELAGIASWEIDLVTGDFTPSAAFCDLVGARAQSEALDRWLALCPKSVREDFRRAVEEAAEGPARVDVTAAIETPAGARRVLRTVAEPKILDGRRILLAVVRDVSEDAGRRTDLWQSANRDALTGLANRALFEDRLETAVRTARRENGHLGVLIVDFADLARRVPRSGYGLPDRHMMDFAARLMDCVRDSDTLARISTTEFGVIFRNIAAVEALDPAVRRLRERFDAVANEDADPEAMRFSAGAAFFPCDAETPHDLIAAAETALQRAKAAPDTPFAAYDRNHDAAVSAGKGSIRDLALQSLDRGEFVPFYQPQMDIHTERIVGAEALVRWQTSARTLDAKDFAAALGDHKVGSQVGELMLEAVIADVAALRKARADGAPFRISINATRSQVLRSDFLDTFQEKVFAGRLSPDDFIIEITEDVIIGLDDRTLRDKVSLLVSSGVEFALDDFGTGYASLIHMASLPFTEVKVDKAFVTGIETDRRKRAIVEAIVRMADDLEIKTVVEGVETEGQLAVLRDIGCRYAQGYYYSTPLPFAEFAAFVESHS